ncbi:tetratricopeptide repeat protein [Amycolatopsis nigrescens]|uniref:tetratricopeptide repeat protein n=1 Tax=Amycolatopsis nigrescens TaxID=381445 RepID=UPI0003A62BFD|nr:tetratricopeptide repeat protein [Amycolatopsis nigrescens]
MPRSESASHSFLVDDARRPVTPRRVVIGDVERVEAATGTLRALDQRYGGGRCRDTVLAYLPGTHALLRAPAGERVAARLSTAVADLHNLAGWTCFDTGDTESAHRHFQLALQLANRTRDHELVANIHYRIGRVHLHQHAPGEALAEFRLGQIAADACGSHRAGAILQANRAWAYAKIGLAGQAAVLLDKAGDELAFDGAVPPPWAAFFDDVELSAMVGTVHTDLARTLDPEHTRTAVPALSFAIGRRHDLTRSKVLDLISLAINHLIDGDLEEAVAVGGHAVDLCASLNSARVIDRMRPLVHEAGRRPEDPGLRRLVARIALLTPARQPYSPRTRL